MLRQTFQMPVLKATNEGKVMIRAFFILLFSALLLLGGCGGSSEDSSRVARTTEVTEQQAVELAKAAARERGSFDDSAEYSAVPSSNGWQVTIKDSSGNLGLVMLDGEGAVVLYQGP